MEEVNFGQEVILTVHTESGDIVFDASGLRVDFDVRQIDGFSRGTFTIYNLEELTIKNIANGENFVTVKTKLHGKQEYTVADSYSINNVLEEKKLPNSITTIYGYDKLRKNVMESQVEITVSDPTLRRNMDAICKEAGYTGKVIYKTFPKGKLDQRTSRKKAPHSGNAQQCIRRLQEEHEFKVYTIGSRIVCMYLPSDSDKDATDLPDKGADVVLDILNMRSNPKIGVATLFVTSVLDGRIEPTSVLDISNLVTVGVDVDEQTLQIANGFLQDSVAGFSKYQTITVQHKGSNYTSEWKTIATATSPTKGKKMPTLSWHKGT